jgi:hypothetical protein
VDNDTLDIGTCWLYEVGWCSSSCGHHRFLSHQRCWGAPHTPELLPSCPALLPLPQSGKIKLELTVTDMEAGDAKHFVPCCVSGSGGNINLDATNKKVGANICQPAGAVCTSSCTAGAWR